MLKPALQLRLGQQLTMTPQLQQAIRLLQLPVLELQAQIREALESNVMLEAEEETGSLETAELEASPQFETATPTAQAPEAPASSDSERTERESDLDIPDDQDWSGDAQITGPSEAPWSGGDDLSQDFSAAGGETLQEHLTWQLEMSRLSE